MGGVAGKVTQQSLDAVSTVSQARSFRLAAALWTHGVLLQLY